MLCVQTRKLDVLLQSIRIHTAKQRERERKSHKTLKLSQFLSPKSKELFLGGRGTGGRPEQVVKILDLFTLLYFFEENRKKQNNNK